MADFVPKAMDQPKSISEEDIRRLLQYLGRVLRPAPGKKRALLVDYVEVQIGVLRASARARQRVYDRIEIGSPQ